MIENPGLVEGLMPEIEYRPQARANRGLKRMNGQPVVFPFDWVSTVPPLLFDQPFLNKNRDYLLRRRLMSLGNIFNRLAKIAEEVAHSSSQFSFWLKLAKLFWQHIVHRYASAGHEHWKQSECESKRP